MTDDRDSLPSTASLGRLGLVRSPPPAMSAPAAPPASPSPPPAPNVDTIEPAGDIVTLDPGRRLYAGALLPIQ